MQRSDMQQEEAASGRDQVLGISARPTERVPARLNAPPIYF